MANCYCFLLDGTLFIGCYLLLYDCGLYRQALYSDLLFYFESKRFLLFLFHFSIYMIWLLDKLLSVLCEMVVE